MPALFCPRCQHSNPDTALFCHFDGIDLRTGQANGGGGRLHQEFAFPSGKRCRTFDELAQACQEDWASARELLRKGVFVRYFSTIGRMDLARTAQESMEQKNADMGLSNLVSCLPGSAREGPRLDLHPRRLVLGTMLAGETQQVPLMLSNQGQGMLQGTVSVTEGGEWLRISDSSNGQCGVRTSREQQVMLQVDTRGLAAGQAYGARLTVVTNGGVVDLPARLELAAQAFGRPPLEGARTPREMAERMRAQPKAAAGFLESGEICRWFEANGWNYPVRGAAARGVAGVQQFFECMGLSKPPPVALSQTEAFHYCQYPEGARGQIMLVTPAKKWVHASVESDVPWLNVLTPVVSGPQQAQIGYEIDPDQAPQDQQLEGRLTVAANGGQKLVFRVGAQVEGRKVPIARRLFQPMLTCAVAFALMRLILVPIVDVYGRGAAADAAISHVSTKTSPVQPPSLAWGGWLQLKWTPVLLSAKPDALDPILGEAGATVSDGAYQDRTRVFRDNFTSYFLRIVIGWTWWLGAIVGVFLLWRRGNVKDGPWGLIAGAAAGVVGGATVGCAVIIGDLGPHLIFDSLFSSKESGLLLLPLWGLLTAIWWGCLGCSLGFCLTLLGPFGRPLLYPFQVGLAGTFRVLGLRQFAEFFAPL